SLEAVLPQVDPDQATTVAARVRGGAAKSVSVTVNGKSIGSWTLAKHETKVVVARAAMASLVPGSNEIQLRFFAPAHTAPTERLADLDWIHIGTVEVDPSFGAPTRQDAVASSTVGGVTRRAVSLRGPGYLRCGGHFPAGAHFETSIGLAGSGDADIEVRL